MTLPVLPSAISSQGLADGPSPCAAPAGETTDPFGRVLAHANLSARQARDAGLLTTAIYGPRSSTLSACDALQSSLENRLRLLLNGSDLCEVTWRPYVTPWGQSRFKPRARVRTICATDGFGAPSIAMWVTATETQAGGTPEQFLERKRRSFGAKDPKITDLAMQALTAALWGTARANDSTGAKVSPGRTGGPGLKTQAVTAHSTGTSDTTEKRGALNPDFVCWLMGFPAEWVCYGVSAMLSTPARPRRSLKR